MFEIEEDLGYFLVLATYYYRLFEISGNYCHVNPLLYLF